MSNDYPEIDYIWDIAELLRGDYKRSDYGKVILPFTVLRRLDCILAPLKLMY
jgi:type I restriction enzyme M protein